MQLDLQTVRHIAHLGRLQLTEAEEERFGSQLGTLLTYVEELDLLDTEGVEPMAHALEICNVFRPDEPGKSLGVDLTLAGTADRQGDTFRVPVVVETEDVLED